MKLEHLPGVLVIEELSFSTPWSHHAFSYEILHNNFSCYLVALIGQRVIGYAGMWLVLDEAHVTNIAVHPDFRNKKVGRGLMLNLLAHAVAKGATRMTLEVRPSNTRALSLYKGLGFKRKGIRKKYYTDNDEDAIIMWKEDLVQG
ncbi:ribosomal protein S18-alanine N-acetyltransferase [Desulfofalx alkaliphila]|uniref:ribosomal protein S18-alanine N-acetyltransferase n=1 Tax=Desulfofalx alkaliphila TaxID=105483 RepID=UPI0004E258EE|nr:ribosomal protein S18-alanine N-acetyltransferase [Desulfofalx alkaliphila]